MILFSWVRILKIATLKDAFTQLEYPLLDLYFVASQKRMIVLCLTISFFLGSIILNFFFLKFVWLFASVVKGRGEAPLERAGSSFHSYLNEKLNYSRQFRLKR